MSRVDAQRVTTDVGGARRSPPRHRQAWLRLDGRWQPADLIAWFRLDGQWFVSVQLQAGEREVGNYWYDPDTVIRRLPGQQPPGQPPGRGR